MGKNATMFDCKVGSIFEKIDSGFFFERDIPQHAEYIRSGNYYEWYYAFGAYYKPKTILEIGVRFGYSLLSMIVGSPSVEYVRGWDIDCYSADSHNVANSAIRSRIKDGIDFSVDVVNSQELTELPQFFDLIHIDGDHSYEGKVHDLELCIGKCRVMVVDDYWHHQPVQQAVNDFLMKHYGKIQTAHIVPTHRGAAVIEFN